MVSCSLTVNEKPVCAAALPCAPAQQPLPPSAAQLSCRRGCAALTQRRLCVLLAAAVWLWTLCAHDLRFAAAWRPLQLAAPTPPRRVHLINVYALSDSPSARLPLYMNYFLESCGWNAADVDCTVFVLVADRLSGALAALPPAGLLSCRPLDAPLPSNVALHVVNDTAWQARLRAATGHAKVWGVENMLKLADYKPAHADIFAEYVPEARYSHWGYVDPDVILGRVSAFFSFADDAYVTYFRGGWHETTASGQLTILRNTAPLRTLWRDSYAAGACVECAYYNKKRLTISELQFGTQLFHAAEAQGLRFSHREESFTDERGNKGRFYDYFWEAGRVFARRTCFPETAAPPVEGVLLHIWAMKKFLAGAEGHQTFHNCSAWHFPTPTPWREPRWNYSFITKDDSLLIASFHDAEWRTCGRPPCKCSAKA
jgi:hypothetical protein